MSIEDPGRRWFLQMLAAKGAHLSLGALGLGSWMRAAHADSHCDSSSWGAIQGTVGGSGGWTCDNHAGYKILEIYLTRGSSQWETFWLPGGAAPNFSDFGMGSLPLSGLDWSAHSADFPCEPPDIPPSYDDHALFATDANGDNIYWGAPARPLYRRNDIFSRCRMVTQYHELAPHPAAIPYALSGLKLGNPRRAGTGAAIQRRARAVDPAQLLPVSYVLYRADELPVSAAAATGMHPGFTRPLVIKVGNNNNFYNNLARSNISAESDDLLLALRHEYRDRLRFRGYGDPVRSPGFDDYWVAAELLKDAPSMQVLFEDSLLVIDSNVARCPEHPTAATPTGNFPAAKTMLHAAASLLTSGPARYVCTIDNGITGTYDTHAGIHLINTNANLYNILHHLADIIHHPTNNPDGIIDLDETMIVINTEFGRTPNINGGSGRDHWPWGYVTTLIGGPLTGGASINGAIGVGDAMTEAAYRFEPPDIRGAIMLSAGVDPFEDGNFRLSDFSDVMTYGASDEADIRDRLRGWILGL